MTKTHKQPKGWLVGKQQIDSMIAKATNQLTTQDYEATVRTCKRIVSYLPQKDKVRSEALGMMGMAYALQKKFEESYQALSEAVQINPEDSYLLFNRGLSARFTSRTGQSLRDFEKVATMKMDSPVASRVEKELELARHVVFSEIKMRGNNFTIDQLIEQQELVQQGNNFSVQGKWPEAESAFRKAIALGDCLPQPWGNLGICLAMQYRFEEAEAAYRQALRIDPQYKRARENLDGLDYWRSHPEEKPAFMISSPFQDIKTNITFYPENK